jgi:hypothetical protein
MENVDWFLRNLHFKLQLFNNSFKQKHFVQGITDTMLILKESFFHE